MPNPNDILTDEIIRHAVYLGRYTRQEIAEMMKILEGANEGLILEVMRGTDRVDQARLLAKIESLYSPAMAAVATKLTADMKELATYELERATALADKIGISFNMPAPTKVFETIMATPADAGTPMEVMFRRFDQNTRDRIAAVVRQNIVEGKGPAAMVKALRGEVVKPARWIMQDGKRVLRPGIYKGGVYETTTRGAEALAQTVVIHTYNEANNEVYKENADLLSGVKWIATLDFNTCEDCAALDGQEWGVNEEHPVPPYHPRCHCAISPVVAGYADDTSPRYQDWLAKQSEERQNDILGVGRADIFRSGEKLSDMSDGGRMLTLSELKEKDGVVANPVDNGFSDFMSSMGLVEEPLSAPPVSTFLENEQEAYNKTMADKYSEIGKEKNTGRGKAIGSYSTGGSKFISNYCANPNDESFSLGDKTYLKNQVKKIDSYVADYSLRQDTPLYRGMRLPDQVDSLGIGDEIKSPSFQSFSSSQEKAKEFATKSESGQVLMRLVGREGDAFAPVGSLGGFGNECEYIAKRGQSYRITGKSKDGAITVFDVEVKK